MSSQRGTICIARSLLHNITPELSTINNTYLRVAVCQRFRHGSISSGSLERLKSSVSQDFIHFKAQPMEYALPNSLTVVGGVYFSGAIGLKKGLSSSPAVSQKPPAVSRCFDLSLGKLASPA